VYDIIGWLSSIQRPDEDSKQLLLFHYMDDVKGCGIQLESRLRECFFKILEQLAQLLSWCVTQDLDNEDNYNFTRFLISSFQWNFLARDFSMLHKRLSIFNLLYCGSITHDKTSDLFTKSNFEQLWQDPRS